MSDEATAALADYDRLVAELTKPTPRKCGSCQFCCKLIPVEEIGKRFNTRCRHQRHGKGCSIYARRPFSCKAWSCGWLVGMDLPRPDHAHYVVDEMMDVIACDKPEGGTDYVDVIQVWVDPAYPDAWDCLKLRTLLIVKRVPAIIRLSETLGFTLWPPNITADGTWHRTQTQHSTADRRQIAADRERAEGRG